MVVVMEVQVQVRAARATTSQDPSEPEILAVLLREEVCGQDEEAAWEVHP